jgi:hypothetical protein
MTGHLEDLSKVSDEELERLVAEQRRSTRTRASFMLTVIQELQQRSLEPTLENIVRILSEGDATPEEMELIRRKMKRATLT